MIVGDWRPATVSEVADVTPTARVLRITVPGWPGSEPGQHVDVRLTAEDGYQAVRSYSIASVGPGSEIELAVERLPDGEVSPFLVDELELGDGVELRGPLGGWFVWRPGDTRPVQLIAGGSGVVPFVAMMRSHARAGSTAPMRLLYSLRTPEGAYFRDELSQPGPHVTTTYHYTRAAPPGWSRAAGRLTAEDLERATLPPSDGPLTYICGPTGFVEAITAALTTLGHSPDTIRTERFGGT